MDESANRTAYPAGGMDSRGCEYDGDGMRMLVVVGAGLLMACGSVSEDPDPVDAGPPVVANPDPECDGSNTRHICGAIQATASYRYGATPKCAGEVYLRDASAAAIARIEGREGCVLVSGLTGDAPPTALCCP